MTDIDKLSQLIEDKFEGLETNLKSYIDKRNNETVAEVVVAMKDLWEGFGRHEKDIRDLKRRVTELERRRTA